LRTSVAPELDRRPTRPSSCATTTEFATAKKGVTRAIANVSDALMPRLVGFEATRRRDIEQLLIEINGTDDRSTA
jgi:enolase